MHDPIVDALAAGATVVTPNNRLARHLKDRHDRAQLRAGKAAWPSARALPWEAWLGALWTDALDAGAFDEPFALLNPAQSRRLWEQAIEADGTDLLDPRATAVRAQRAWQVFAAHARAGESPSQWMGGEDDAAAFARWHRRYLRACHDAGARDLATAAEALATAAVRLPSLQAPPIVVAGFTELTPQAQGLVARLRDAGVTVTEDDLATRRAAREAAPTRRVFASPVDEMVAALQWARARAERAARDPRAEGDLAIGAGPLRATIAVRDLESRRARVIELADEILRPASLAQARLGDAAPYNLSLAVPLAEHAMSVAALDLLALSAGRLPLACAATLVRAPFLAGGAPWALRRGDCERRWREANRAELGLADVAEALAPQDPLREGLTRIAMAARDATPRAPDRWADAFRERLRMAGWPGDESLSSARFQAVDAFWEAMGEWRTLSLVEPRLGARAAVASLAASMAHKRFQPEATPSPVDIVGLLEAAGQSFDALWLAGMDAASWPLRAAPLPFIPASWQHARGVVEASPERTRERAARLTAQLEAGAATLVASHVAGVDRPPAAPSPLMRAWPVEAVAPEPRPTAACIAAAPARERVDDARLPALARGSAVRGGQRVIELQSDCPFRASAALRFTADRWPAVSPGLTPLERGIALHAALAAFWNEVRDQATLAALDDAGLAAAAEAAAGAGVAALPPPRWRALPPAAAAAERLRLARGLARFAATQERGRPPFSVAGSERKLRLGIGGLQLSLRADRIDRIEDGASLAIIDYKGGEATPPSQWLWDRPRAPQLGLYLLALAAEGEALPVHAVALASLRAGDARYAGIADAGAGWEGLKAPGKLDAGLPDLAAIAGRWASIYDTLAAAFREGEAAVDPRARARPCSRCDFHPFCRIDDVEGGQDEEGDPEGASADTAEDAS